MKILASQLTFLSSYVSTTAFGINGLKGVLQLLFNTSPLLKSHDDLDSPVGRTSCIRETVLLCNGSAGWLGYQDSCPAHAKQDLVFLLLGRYRDAYYILARVAKIVPGSCDTEFGTHRACCFGC